MLTLRAEDTNASLTHLVAQSVMLARRTEPSSAGRTRTYNHLVNSQTHFQLCYHRSLFPRREVANVGFEPTNSRVRHYPKPARCVPLSPISLLYSIISSIVPFVNTFLPKVDKKIKKRGGTASLGGTPPRLALEGVVAYFNAVSHPLLSGSGETRTPNGT